MKVTLELTKKDTQTIMWSLNCLYGHMSDYVTSEAKGKAKLKRLAKKIYEQYKDSTEPAIVKKV